jgi:hypothetical protein
MKHAVERDAYRPPLHEQFGGLIRLIGPLLFERNDEWAVRRYMSLNTIAPSAIIQPFVRVAKQLLSVVSGCCSSWSAEGRLW